jgi:hypothetical protein
MGRKTAAEMPDVPMKGGQTGEPTPPVSTEPTEGTIQVTINNVTEQPPVVEVAYDDEI